ncbi:hypothetical protein DBZ36_05295 [Alginatibacterium sediminis]|uniref:Uncharacterized protein n=1 Tax=Alginatibacterium sediminis TaxID=2164068 RepID=A0A420EGN8_9ALTE|nr:hypothetical protein [Alginatibacterium sediminis]RKF19875.1 hypothetical protein DBZ36_05295 [Alginatibacterium sediminis]
MTNFAKRFRSSKTLSKIIRSATRIALALLISLVLTVVCAVYIPSIFSNVLSTGLEILPKYKFTHYQVSSKAELAQQWNVTPSDDDKLLFQQLKEQFPPNHDKSTFFAHMFVVQDYPQRCQFTIIAKHRTIDLAWEVVGTRCDDKESCKKAREQQICSDRKHGNRQ